LQNGAISLRCAASFRVQPIAVTVVVAYPWGYTSTANVIEVRQTEQYARWFAGLRDREARSRILARVRRLSLGNPGDVGPVGEGVSEMRIHVGSGYRVCFKQAGVVVLLAGGDKRTQRRDVETAKALVRDLQEE
jgi:putative addiction module killer protein